MYHSLLIQLRRVGYFFSLEVPVETLSDVVAREDKVPVLIRNDPIHQLLKVRNCDQLVSGFQGTKNVTFLQ